MIASACASRCLSTSMRASELGNVQNVWLTNSSKSTVDGGRPVVGFSSTAELVPDAVSKRLAHYTGEDAQ